MCELSQYHEPSYLHALSSFFLIFLKFIWTVPALERFSTETESLTEKSVSGQYDDIHCTDMKEIMKGVQHNGVCRFRKLNSEAHLLKLY